MVKPLPRTKSTGARRTRVSAERVFEIARHLTEHDREICVVLYRHRMLTTEQLTLLFFSSRRRAQDRLLFLYRGRFLDRFYPPRPFGLGKPEAHWLLDEGGAILVAAAMGVERRALGWERRDDWGAHPQLAHRLEANRFVTDLIAATLPDPSLGVTAWWSSGEAAARLSEERRYRRPLPDTAFLLDTPAGAIECYLEWDRGTETRAVLAEKLDGYQLSERRWDAPEQRLSVLFVVPSARRLETLRRAYADAAAEERLREERWPSVLPAARWPLLATTVPELRRAGPLSPIWSDLTGTAGSHALAITELPARDDLPPPDLRQALGRRWRKEQPDFWARLSPLGIRTEPPEGAPRPAPAPELGPATTAPAISLHQRRREQPLEEARRDIEAARAGRRWGDLRSSEVDGLIDELDEDEEERR